MKSKTASVRLPKEMYEEIDELCDDVGCSRNDWIKDTLQDGLRKENSETEDTQPKEEPKIVKGEIISNNKPVVEEPKIVKGEIIEVRMHEEPKQIDNSNKPMIEMVLFDGKYIPKAEVYET